MLKVKAGKEMRVSLFVLWLLVIVFPVLIGSSILKNSLEERYLRQHQQIRHELMNQARSCETFLEPERVFRHLLRLPRTTGNFVNFHRRNRRSGDFVNDPMVKALPDLRDDSRAAAELERYKSFLQKYTGQIPAATIHIDERAESCKVYIHHSLSLENIDENKLKNELAEIALRLNRRSENLLSGVPDYLYDLDRHNFKQLYDFTGVLNFFAFDHWRLTNLFSTRLNHRMNILTIRYPRFLAHDNYLILIFSEGHMPCRVALKSFIRQKEKKGQAASFGFSSSKRLPHFFSDHDSLNLLIEPPYRFKKIFAQQNQIKKGRRPVLKFSFSRRALKKQLHQQKKKIDLLVFLYVISAPLIMLKIIVTNNQNKGLKKLIITAFFVANLLPITGVTMISLSFLQNQQELRIDQAVARARNRIKEAENAFSLHKSRQLTLIRYFAYCLENIPESDWQEFFPKIDPADQHSKLRQFLFHNFLIIDRGGRDFMRANNSRGKGEEIRPMLLGDQLKILLIAGAFSQLGKTEQDRIGQLADISAGLTEQISDPKLLNRLFKDEGQSYYSTTIVRNQLLTSHFLRKKHKLIGTFNSVGNFGNLIHGIGRLIAEKAIITEFADNNQQISLEVYPVNQFADRALSGRISFSQTGFGYVVDKNFDLANSLYVNANSSVVNNLDTESPHLLVTDLILDKEFFVLARISQLSEASLFAMPALILAISLCCCLAISTGISWLLLAPIPPFIKAIKQLNQENFDWTIQVNSGDQFDQLGARFNHLSLKLQERKKMMQLVSNAAIEAVATDLSRFKGEISEVTVLFSDIRNFTTITEQNSAEEVVEMLNEYLTLMTRIIEQHGGYTDKIIGDAIQAVFKQNSDRVRKENACRAAVAMRIALGSFNQHRSQRNKFTIENGIGICSGSVISGLVGSSSGKLDATIFGEPLLLAQYLESQSKYALISRILIDQNTRDHLAHELQVEEFVTKKGESCWQIKMPT